MSEKYTLACDATTLWIRPEYYDFFLRGMIPMEHYWPIRPDNMCRDIKFAVDWGNNHTVEVSKTDSVSLSPAPITRSALNLCVDKITRHRQSERKEPDSPGRA